ncbi:MAG: hypothetical protein Q4F72_12415, partial [Desulfovibrionaceae bacterium]|nr:hypothetical protein [Desulfovibrionaceae bacterium]
NHHLRNKALSLKAKGLLSLILSLPDDPELFSAKVIDCALSGRAAGYGDLVSVNDFRLLLGTWINALNFPSAKKVMAAQGHALRLVSALPDRHYGQARDRLLASLAAFA